MRKLRRVLLGSKPGSPATARPRSARPRSSTGNRRAARGVRLSERPLRTSSGSSNSSRNRESAWLVADWLNPTRAAARVTCRSLSRARSTTSRFKSTLASTRSCTLCMSIVPTLHWTHLQVDPMLLHTNQGETTMFVITGATGHVGSVAAETLLAAGHQVRVVVRDAAKAARLKALGAEVFVADLTDQAALARSVRGARGV